MLVIHKDLRVKLALKSPCLRIPEFDCTLCIVLIHSFRGREVDQSRLSKSIVPQNTF